MIINQILDIFKNAETAVPAINVIITIIAGLGNFCYTKHINNKQMQQDRELNLLDYYDKKYNSLYKVMLIYRINDNNKQEIIRCIQLGYETNNIYGNGLIKESVNELVSIFNNNNYIFDVEIIEEFDKQLNEFQDSVKDRYEEEENDPELARENEGFYFYEFDSEREFYKLIEDKMKYYSKKLS